MKRCVCVVLLLVFCAVACSKSVAPPPSPTLPVPTGPFPPGPISLAVHIKSQTLEVFLGERVVRSYLVSTSRFGEGFENSSHKTPLGQHQIYKKIGAGEPVGRVFVGREPYPFIAPIWHHAPKNSEPRYITTRILWLDGLENRNANTRTRYIYIHGTNQEGAIGHPDSIGCIYMKNTDIIELFDIVEEGTVIDIEY